MGRLLLTTAEILTPYGTLVDGYECATTGSTSTCLMAVADIVPAGKIVAVGGEFMVKVGGTMIEATSDALRNAVRGTRHRATGSFDGAGGVWNRDSPLSVDYSPTGSVVGQGNQPLCGPASCSMVVSDSTGDAVDLTTIANQFDEIGIDGVNGNQMSNVLTGNNVSNEFITDMNSTQLNERLSFGQPVIVNVRAGDNGGHWIVIDSRIEVNGQAYYNVRDPYAGQGVGGGYGVQTDYLISNWNGGNAILID